MPSTRLLTAGVILALLLTVPAAAEAAPNLVVSTTAPASTTPRGANYAVTTTIANTGDAAATNVTGSEHLDTSHYHWVSASVGGGGTPGLGTIAADHIDVVNASLPAGGTMTLTTTFVGDHEGATALDTSAGSTPADTPTTDNATHWAFRVTSLESSVLAADFGPQAIGTIGAPQAVTLVNRWTSALNVQRLRVGGPASTDFITVGDACTGLSLAVGASCQVAVRFAPSALGARQATLTAETDQPASVSPLPIALTGAGVVFPTVAGPQGPAGPPGPAGQSSIRLVLAPAATRVSGRAGATIRLVYASTMRAHVTLQLRKGKKVVARGSTDAKTGANRLALKTKKSLKAGRYTLVLTAKAGGQQAAAQVPVALKTHR